MSPVHFPQANRWFRPPPSLEESQCSVIHAYCGTIERGSVEGLNLIVTAWQPSEEELKALNAGQPVFISFIGVLPPHFATTNFAEATNPA